MLTRIVTICLALSFSAANAETVIYAGVQKDTDHSASQCWLSDRSGDLQTTGNFGVRHDVIESGRWSVALKAEHISCLEGRDMNSTNSVGFQVEFQLFR